MSDVFKKYLFQKDKFNRIYINTYRQVQPYIFGNYF